MITQVKKLPIISQANDVIWNVSIQGSDVIAIAEKQLRK